MAIDFPCNLPAPLVSRNTITPQSAVRMQQVAGGAPYAELFSSDTWTAHNVAWSFSELQYQVFVQWFIWKAKNGSQPINVPVKNSLGLTIQEGYLPTYSSAQNGRRWLVTGQLIVIKQERMDECDAESLIAAFNGFEDVSFAIDYFEEIMANYPEFANGNV